MRSLCRVITHRRRALAALAAVSASPAVFAALPTTAPPSRGDGGGNFITLLQNYAFDIAIFAGLAIAAILFFVVAKNVMTTYSQVADGRATMGQVGMQAMVGVLLLVFIVFLMTQAAGVL